MILRNFLLLLELVDELVDVALASFTLQSAIKYPPLYGKFHQSG